MDLFGFSVVMNSSASSRYAAAICKESIGPTPDFADSLPAWLSIDFKSSKKAARLRYFW